MACSQGLKLKRGRIYIQPLSPGKLIKLLADFEHFGAANGANTLSGRTAILHGDGLGAFHFLLFAALYTITLHGTPP
jgi:hypothetical protein